MNKRLVVIAISLMFVLFAGYHLMHRTEDAEQTFSKNTIRYGSTGADVYELQGRLKFLGFYYAKVDGDFGYNTLKSVKWFQSEFGLVVDGIVGDKTKLKLWEATKAYKPTAAELPPSASRGTAGGQTSGAPSGMTPSTHLGYSKQELDMMANAVYGEARGEPYVGQVAVAAVILNRVKSKSFPNTPTGVIFEPRAFTAVSDGQIWLTPNATARKAVLDAVNGWDPTGGCLYYFNPDTATSAWIWTRQQVKKIGKHIFCI